MLTNVRAAKRDVLHNLIEEYLSFVFEEQKIVLIIDAKVGPTKDDLDILSSLERLGKNIVIAVNKIDKLKNSEIKTQKQKISSQVGPHKIGFYSAEKSDSVKELWAKISE